MWGISKKADDTCAGTGFRNQMQESIWTGRRKYLRQISFPVQQDELHSHFPHGGICKRRYYQQPFCTCNERTYATGPTTMRNWTWKVVHLVWPVVSSQHSCCINWRCPLQWAITGLWTIQETNCRTICRPMRSIIVCLQATCYCHAVTAVMSNQCEPVRRIAGKGQYWCCRQPGTVPGHRAGRIQFIFNSVTRLDLSYRTELLPGKRHV